MVTWVMTAVNDPRLEIVSTDVDRGLILSRGVAGSKGTWIVVRAVSPSPHPVDAASSEPSTWQSNQYRMREPIMDLPVTTLGGQ